MILSVTNRGESRRTNQANALVIKLNGVHAHYRKVYSPEWNYSTKQKKGRSFSGGHGGRKRWGKEGGGASVQGLLHRRTLSSHKASGFVIDANGLRVATKKFTGIHIPFRK